MLRAKHYALLLMMVVSSQAQGPPDATIEDALRSLASRAAVIFVGQVVKVESRAGVVEVTFRVEQPVQGSAGGSYTLLEWAGLWSSGQPHYVPGQRAMYFFHAPSHAGISTPVDGMEGVVPVVVTTADAAPSLDVRWLATQVQREVNSPLPSAKLSVEDAVAAIRSVSGSGLHASPLQPKPLPAVPVRLVPSGPEVFLHVVPDVR